MRATRHLLEGSAIRAVDICRLLTIILREYREFGRMRPERFLPVEYRVRQAIVRGIVTICAELDVTVIAEGIESAGERDFLADCGIFLMQGYWFAKPAFKALAQVSPEVWTH
jgi:maleate cis-trans isomerase